MQDKDDMMRSWCIEKATNVVVMLAYAVSAINRLPERSMQDDDGLPTEDSALIGSVFDAIWDATKLLAYHVGASWSPDDAEVIRKDGIDGYARVAARYGLTLPPPTVNMPDDDPRQLVVRTAWVYYEEGSGWGWMYWPPPLRDSYEQPSARRGFATEVMARESARQVGYLVAPIPPGQQPIRLGSLVRFVEGETYTSEEIAAFNAGTLASEALTVIPDGAQVDLVGREGVDHVIRYQNRELTVPHDTILWEQPPQRTSPPLRLLLWREMSPLIIRDLATLEQHGSILWDWRLETFALDRPIAKDCKWDGVTFDAEQQRATLAASVEAIMAYIARLPHAERVALCGPVGAGKSHLAFATAYAAAQRGLAAGYLETSQLPFQWRPSALRALDAFREIDLLVLDDLFISERPSSKFTGPISELIAYRRAQQRPTVFTSTLPLKQLPDLVREDTTEIRLPLSDHRTLRSQHQPPDTL